jgi:alpha-tubulin suppressor-like RCC1 family protein
MTTLFATGSNFFGQIGIGNRKRESLYLPTPFGCTEDDSLDASLIEDYQCGNQFTAVLLKNGSIQFCGNLYGAVVPSLSPVEIPLPISCKQIACGRKHILALFERGVVMSWGVGYFGQLGHGDDSSWENPRIISALDPRRLGAKVVSISCGGSHSGAVTENNRLFMWGLNRGGQCGTNSKADSVLEPRPVDSTELTPTMKITKLVCGRNHSAALTSIGQVFVWGEATFGRLGLNDNRKRQPHPVLLHAFKAIPVHSIASGDFHMLAVGHDGSVYSWGYNCDGQAGQASLVNLRTPRRIERLDDQQIVAVECGASWSVAITQQGHVFTWGYGDGGWLGIRPPSHMVSLDCDHTSPSQAALATSNAHAISFDSRHNIIVPQKMRFLADEWRVERVRAGGAHMLLMCSPRLQNNDTKSLTTSNSSSKSPSSTKSVEVSPLDFRQVSSTAQLISWSRHCKLAELSEALAQGASVDCRDSAGNTPLIVACQTGHLVVCELLLSHGANLNLANAKGNTALHYSFNYGYEDIGAFLIERGADEFATNGEGLTCYEGLTQSDLDLL